MRWRVGCAGVDCCAVSVSSSAGDIGVIWERSWEESG